MITTLLIANRGEIARRVIRTARRMGISTVAIFSDADRDAPHVREADRAVRIGPEPAAQSYLDISAVIAAAKAAGADAVHPGYGFLSENAAFARACAEAGIVFVGPSPEAIEAMGDKARAKALMVAAGVPVVPGYQGEDQTDDRLAAEAQRIGFPVMVKAVAGGGGRGMRRVERAGDLAAAVESAAREARNAFGDGRLLIEKLVTGGRHIEVQVFGDLHGSVIHLGERDCSAQRRHQKVIEEQPSPFVGPDLRARMTADAVRAAQAVGYVGAGTVEFVVDAAGDYRFLEMNTRLQVEHPVTEEVTGLDLVELQLRVAMGEALPRQDEIAFAGHAVEARLYAEDPAAGFAPQTGRVARFAAPAGIRVDSGVETGSAVTPHYDPMVAKLIAHAPTRAEAIDRLRDALASGPLFGLAHNAGWLVSILDGEAFRDGAMTTDLLDRDAASHAPPAASPRDFAVAALALAFPPGADWFRSSGVADPVVRLRCREVEKAVRLAIRGGRLAGVSVGGEAVDLADPVVTADTIGLVEGGVRRRHAVHVDGRRVELWDGRALHRFEEPDLLAAKPRPTDGRIVVSPVTGTVRAVLVAPGGRVGAGAAVAVVEAMKMETTLVAGAAGTVVAVHVREGAQVGSGTVVVEIDVEVSG